MKIIVRLTGGIGNQFFQYAAGRSLSIRHNCELILDDSLLNRKNAEDTPRSYELDAFNIQARKISEKEAASLKFRVQRPFRYLYEIGLLKTSFSYYREPHFEFDPKYLRLTGDLIIEGYWQSERYFADIAAELRRELQPKKSPDSNVHTFLSQMLVGNSVSLHIRRGDYLSNPNAAAHHVVCDLDYYRRAVAMIAERVKNPVFFVFSDDPEWVANEFKIDFPTTIVTKLNAWPAYEDLRMMSHCAHHIIANSSFSWWGAWLNASPSKIVVAPSKWFKVDKNIKDLIPPDWKQA